MARWAGDTEAPPADVAELAVRNVLSVLNADDAAIWATDATGAETIGAAVQLRDLVSGRGLRVPAAEGPGNGD